MKARLPDAKSVIRLTRGGGESIDIPVRLAPLALVQLMAVAYPEPKGASEEEVSKYNRTIMLVRVGYSLTMEGADTCPSTPFPDWKTATPEILTAYAEALQAEIEEAGFTVSDYLQLIEGLTLVNNRKVGESGSPKA